MKCKICDCSNFSLYSDNVDVDLSTVEDEVIYLPKFTSIYLIRCCRCDSTVWNKAGYWYPFLSADTERWRNRNLKVVNTFNEDSTKAQLLKSLTADDIKAILAMRGKV